MSTIFPITVYTGQIATTDNGQMLISSPLGSCIAVCAFSAPTMVGGMAHVMLPGHPPQGLKTNRNRYAANALATLFGMMEASGSTATELQLYLVGGANVLKRPQDTIHLENLSSLKKLIEKKGVRIAGYATGGYERMVARLDAQQGLLFNAVGNGPETLLFDFLSS